MMTPERRAEIEGKLDDPILGRNLELEECLAEIDRLLPLARELELLDWVQQNDINCPSGWGK